jgi:hypothetical protein
MKTIILFILVSSLNGICRASDFLEQPSDDKMTSFILVPKEFLKKSGEVYVVDTQQVPINKFCRGEEFAGQQALSQMAALQS